MNIERIANENDLIAIHQLLMHQYVEIGLAKLNEEKVLETLWATFCDGVIIGLRSAAGDIVGSCGLRLCEYWYSDETYYLDNWLFVQRDERYQNGAALLLGGCGDLAKETGKNVVVAIGNPFKHANRGKKVIGQGFVIVPTGPRIALQ